MRRPSARAEVLTDVRGSRFLASLERTLHRRDADEALKRRRAAHTDATHHCWAFRLWTDGSVTGAGFDAGEPGGTAGRPILGVLERFDVVAVTCVVSRWFGGTKLGTGGLVRAYAEATRRVVEAADLVDVEPWSRLRVTFDYADTAGVQRLAARFGVAEESAEYAARVQCSFVVPLERDGAFRAGLRELGAGTVDVVAVDTVLRPTVARSA